LTRDPRLAQRFEILAILLLGAGLLVLGLGGHAPAWSPPPVPPALAAVAATEPPSAGPNTRPVHRHAQAMSRSIPVQISIPAIGVRARIIPLGLQPDGEVAVPSLSTPFLTSWYDRGPTPGQAGAAVILGHVDAAGVGPAVFYRLGDLRQGDLIYITRQDRRTAVFRVSAVGLYPQDAFPTARVYAYGGSPELRLITCGGRFDSTRHLYLDRTIAFADFKGS
jgi:sortase (surface protein transpeptidase)